MLLGRSALDGDGPRDVQCAVRWVLDSISRRGSRGISSRWRFTWCENVVAYHRYLQNSASWFENSRSVAPRARLGPLSFSGVEVGSLKRTSDRERVGIRMVLEYLTMWISLLGPNRNVASQSELIEAGYGCV